VQDTWQHPLLYRCVDFVVFNPENFANQLIADRFKPVKWLAKIYENIKIHFKLSSGGIIINSGLTYASSGRGQMNLHLATAALQYNKSFHEFGVIACSCHILYS
jgi:hypothetical protein